MEGIAETDKRNAHYEIGTLILSKKEHSYYQKEHSYYQKGTHQKGTLILLKRNSSKRNTLVLSKGTLILSKRNSSKRNTHIIKKELIKKEHSYYHNVLDHSDHNRLSCWGFHWYHHLQGKFLWSLDKRNRTQRKRSCVKQINKISIYFYFVLFSRTTPLPQLGLWAFERFLRGFPSPWAHDPFFTLVSGFSSQITWLPVPWAHHPILTTGQRFPPPEMIWRHWFALDQSGASICHIRAPFTTSKKCQGRDRNHKVMFYPIPVQRKVVTG